jgi:outer membrane protein assembly factor BamB
LPTIILTTLLVMSGVAVGTGAEAVTPAATPPTYTWSRIGNDAGNTSVSADPSISTSNAAHLGVRWMANTGAASVSSPVTAWSAQLGMTLVFLGNDAGYITAFDQATGATVWSDQLGSEIVSTPLVEGNELWVSRDFSPVLYKIDIATGAIQCSTPLVSTSEGSPTIGTPAGGSTSIYIGVNDRGNLGSGPVYSINESDCSVNWQFTGYDSVAGSWDPLSFGTDANGRSLVLFGTSDPDRTVYAVNALTGQLVWSYVTPPEPGDTNPDIDVAAGVTVSPPGNNGFADGVAYVPCEDGYMLAFDLTTGTLLWSTYFGGDLPQYHTARATAALIGDSLVFGEASGVRAINATTGAIEWSYDTDDVESISVAAGLGPPGGQVVAVTTVAGAFDVLDASDGRLLYQYQSPAFSTSSFADVDGNLLVGSSDGYLYDIAVGGGNGAGPTTSTGFPTRSAKLANPRGSVVIRGSAAAAAGGVAGVDIAIQSGDGSGPWWNGQTQTWVTGFADNLAAVAKVGAAHTTWSYPLPVSPSGGTFRVEVGAVQQNGLADVTDLTSVPKSTNFTFTVLNAPGVPHLVAATKWVVPGTTVSVAGSGFQAGESVVFSFDGTVMTTKKASSTGGTGSVNVKIPAAAAFGPAVVVATGESSGLSTSTEILVSNAWTGSGYNAAHTNYEPNDPVLVDSVAPGPPDFLNPAWTDSTGAAVRTSPAIAHGVAYIANDAGLVEALNVHTGQPAWTTTEASAVRSSPAVGGSLVVFGTMGDSVVALRQADGSPAWSVPTSSPVESSPALTANSVVVGTDNGTVYDLDLATGAINWTATLAGAVTASPSVDSATGIVVVGDSSGAITALSASTGAVLWTVQTGGPVTAAATLYLGTVYVGSGDGSVYALAESTGTTLWTRTTSGPITAGGSIYALYGTPRYYAVGSGGGDVYLLDLSDGSVYIDTPIGGPVVGLAASIGWISATTSNGQLWGLKRNAEPIWTVTEGAPFASAPVVVNGNLFVGSTDQTITAYSVTGRPIP